MNADEEEAAGQAGIQFASTANALQNHELCTDKSWVNPLGYLSNFTFNEDGHPTPAGQGAIACAVAADLGYESATPPTQCKGITAAPFRLAQTPTTRTPRRGRAVRRVNQTSLTVQAEAPTDGQVGAPSPASWPRTAAPRPTRGRWRAVPCHQA